MTLSFFRPAPAFPIPQQNVLRASRRPYLIARWRRAADGKLECRWKRVEDQDWR